MSKRKPDYRRVYDELYKRLSEREWELGDKIPSINALQVEYGITSLNIVRQAQQMLVEEGCLRTEQGRGAFVVAHPKPLPDKAQTEAALAAIDEAMRSLAEARRVLEWADQPEL